MKFVCVFALAAAFATASHCGEDCRKRGDAAKSKIAAKDESKVSENHGEDIAKSKFNIVAKSRATGEKPLDTEAKMKVSGDNSVRSRLVEVCEDEELRIGCVVKADEKERTEKKAESSFSKIRINAKTRADVSEKDRKL